MQEHFAQWLDRTLMNEGITARELAQRLDVHESAVSRWRKGQSIPSPKATTELAKVLNVDQVRLLVTAGHLDPSVGVEPLPLPPATAHREQVRRKLKAIPGLTESTVERMLAVAYDEEQPA